MNDILDEIKVQKKKAIFTSLSLLFSVCAILALICVAYLLAEPIRIKDDPIIQKQRIASYLLQGFTVGSMLLLIISYVRKEPKGWKKTLASLLSLILIVFVFGVRIAYLLFGRN